MKRDAVLFQIASKQIDVQNAEGSVLVWLDQGTKLPLKIETIVGGWSITMDEFDWNPTLPARAVYKNA